MEHGKWAISTLQAKNIRFLKAVTTKYQNRHFHTPAANSLLLQKWAWHNTTHFVVEGHKQTDIQKQGERE